jgi:hypothetical protein
MVQTSLDFFMEKIVDLMIGLTFYENQRQDLQDAYKIAKEKHKEETIRFIQTMPKEKGITQEGEAYVQYDAEKHYNQTYNK